jgi:hypothetical protein
VYLREKGSGPRRYLQVVEGYRDGGRVRQRVLLTLGRLDKLRESGQLDALLASGARFSEKLSVIGAHKRGELKEHRTVSIGPGLVFHRLWQETGIEASLREVLRGRHFEFDVEAVVFATVVQRLVAPGSDRAAQEWRRNYLLPGADDLELQHFYRAMAWLGEELPLSEQAGRTPFAPRCVKDLVEEHLFTQRRSLFTELVLAFFDTTSIYFEGDGGETLGENGKTKDNRPDLKQMVVGLILDEIGRPICCELWPGNTTDVTTLIPVINRLRVRFHVGKVTVVADRGMISGKTIKALEAREDTQYILGARMRKQKEVNETVLARAGRYHEVTPKRLKAKDPSPLKVKEVWVKDKDPSKAPRRYVVCYNDDQARKDREDRERILKSLQAALQRGDKSLVGNKGYRKFLKPPASGFEINEEKIQAEERLDGKWVLRTNTDWPSTDVALTYKQLWMVETLFRAIKSLLETRPIFHKRDATIRGHVFCSFLALVLMRELQDRLVELGCEEAEWADVIRDLDHLYETEVTAADGKRFILRTETKGWCGKTFQAAGVAIPQTVRLVGDEVQRDHA